MNLCAHQVSNCPVCTRVRGECFRAGGWLSRNVQAHSVSGQTSRAGSRTTGSEGKMCLICSRWRMTSFSGVSQRSRPTLRNRGSTGASALRRCCRLAVPQCALLSATAEFDSQVVLEAVGSDIDVGDGYPLATAAFICNKLHSARYPDPAHFSFQTLRSRPALSPTSSRLSLLSWLLLHSNRASTK